MTSTPSPDPGVPDGGPWDATVPTHRRVIEVEAFERDGDFELVAHLRDERPWAQGPATAGAAREMVHEMELRVTVQRPEMVITSAQATMSTIPHPECADIEDAFEGLVGLNVARGYTRAVQERFGRQNGCAHLEFLARALAPVVIQVSGSAKNRAVARGETDASDAPGPLLGPEWLTNTCHVWSEGGVGQQLMELGWRPGPHEYPAPSLVELRRRRAEDPDPA